MAWWKWWNRRQSRQLQTSPTPKEIIRSLVETRDVEQLLAWLRHATQRHDNDLIELAARGLGEIGDRRALVDLLQLMKYEYISESFSIGPRIEAAEALAKIGGPEAMEALSACYAGDSRIWGAVKSCVRQIGPPATDPLVSVFESSRQPDTRDGAARLLKLLGWTPMDPRQRVLLALANFYPDEERAIVAEGRAVLSILIDALKHPSLFVRSSAAEALGKIGDERAVMPLIAALNDERFVRDSVIIALGRIGDPRATEPLLTALKATAGTNSRYAIEALERLADRRAVDTLIEVLSRWYWEEATDAAKALGEIGDERAVEPLIAALEHRSANVRIAAIDALAKIGGHQSVKALVALSQNNENQAEHAVTALECLLKDRGEIVEEDDLRVLGRLSGIEQSDEYTSHDVDLSRLHTLAKTELAHRRSKS